MIFISKIIKYVIQKVLNFCIQNGKLWFLCITCSTLITVLLLWAKIELHSNKKMTILYYNNKLPEIFVPTTSKQVTKSLSEMMRKVPEINEDIVLFNSVPKSGGELIVLLLQWLESFNGFKHVRLPGGNKHTLNRYEQEKMIQTMMTEVRDGALPLTFDRHVFFINFTSFGHQSPIYINLIRDPIDKAIATYYYHHTTPTPASRYTSTSSSVKNPNSKISISWRTKLHYAVVREFEKCVKRDDPNCIYNDGEMYDLTIPYFCGQDEFCMMLNDQSALNRAKQNVERYFPVVGILEEVNSTLFVLQHQLPYFFRDVLNVFTMHLSEKKARKLYRPISVLDKEVRKKLESQLAAEYEFYHYIKKRLLNQHALATVQLDL
ncbi:uronyl 2-sulfotransferase homolog pip-like isoform X2 [Lycorma delicatula]|uniref:uronyl 2-sulfotransferase homolog pip-like isoform X2 n=1 Tax=Lycorma delicatula TaxID=130591 RepID=UPI003F51510D